MTRKDKLATRAKKRVEEQHERELEAEARSHQGIRSGIPGVQTRPNVGDSGAPREQPGRIVKR